MFVNILLASGGCKYGSRLGNASPTACITCSARCIRESKAFRLLRTKHANANSFALLSASAYICKLNFNTITYNGK